MHIGTIILEIIDHSRKLSLLQYDNELNYGKKLPNYLTDYQTG